MAEDNVQANIRIGIDTSDALVSIKNLQRQISAFHTSMANGSAANAAAAANFQKTLIDNINATKKFSASVQTVRTTTETFTNSLEKNKLSLGQYFRYAGGASKSFGRLFATEFETINKVARERVKDLQTQYIRMGRDANGAMKAIAVRPLVLDMDNLATKTAIAAQRQQLLNQLLKQGSTNLLNFGKNTQWAGRQLMVGFTIPLSIFGSTAAKSFMTIEEQAIKFRRVYGDLMTDTGQTEAMLESIKTLASEFTKYGIAVDKTMGLAASAAAQGKTGADLTAQVAEATRLSVLGQVEQQQALDTTISVTNAFGVAAEDLASKIDFLNAVENQTVTSIEDLTVAIPKAGPVVKQLGGNVEDLTFFLTAMREGGINASEGANALKSGLASLINPTEKASTMLAGYGINIKKIVESNKGDVKGIVIDFATALDKLDPLKRARAIEQLFGKFQFSRLSTLFQNVIGEGTQAQKVLEMAGQTSQQLAQLSARELEKISESPMFKFKKSIEDIKVALAPIGETFLKLATPVIEFGTKILNAFNSLDERTKNFVAGLVGVVGGIGPILLMTFGLLANGIANIIKGFTFIKNVFNGASVSSNDLGSQISYMTTEQIKAASVAASLDQVHGKLTQTFTSEANAINAYVSALQKANTAAAAFNVPAVGRSRPMKLASGIISVPGPRGAGDVVPAMLSPEEAVIPAKPAKKYRGLIQGIIADNIPGYAGGKYATQATHVAGTMAHTPQVIAQVEKFQPGFSGLPKEIQDFFDILSDLTSDKSRTLNQAARGTEGMGADQFLAEWSSSPEGLRAVGKRAEQAGEMLIDSANNSILDGLDAEIGRVTAGKIRNLDASEKKIAGWLDKLIQDSTTEVVNRAANSSDPKVRNVSSGLKARAQRVASIRYRPKIDGMTEDQIIKDQMSRGLIERRGRGFFASGTKIKTGRLAYSADKAARERQKLDVSRAIASGGNIPVPIRGTSAAYGSFKNQPGGTYEGSQSQKSIKEYGVLAAKDLIAAETSILGQEKNDPIMLQRSEKRNSPHPQASIDGADDARARIAAQEKVFKRQSRRIQGVPTGNGGMSIIPVPMGSQATTVVDSGVGRTPRRAFREADADVRARVEKESAAAITENTNAVKTNTKIFGAGLRNASYVVSGLSGVALMFGQNMGNLTNVIFGASMALSALTTAAELNAAGGFLGLSPKSAGANGIGGFFSRMVTVGGKAVMSLGRFAGVVGIAITAISGFIMLANYINDQREKERLKIEGLGDAALLTKEKLKTLGEFFGVAITKSPLERAKAAIPMRREDRVQVDSLRDSQAFKDTFKNDIKSLRDATVGNAKMVLESISIQLEGSGFAKDQIDKIIKALQEESGKTSIKLDFAKVSLKTESGQKLMAKTAKDLASGFSKSFDGNMERSGIFDRPTEIGGQWVERMVPNDMLQTKLNTASKIFSGMLSGISNSFANGVINSEQFNKSLSTVTDEIKGMPEPSQLLMLDTVLGNLDSPLADSAKQVKNLSDKYLILKAAMLGVSTITENDIKILTAASLQPANETLQRIAANTRKTIESQIGSTTKILDDFASQQAGGGGGGGTGESAFTRAMKQIKDQTLGLLEQTKAFNKLKSAGYDTEEAFKIAKDPILAAALASTKVGTKEWKTLTAAIKKSEKAAKDFAAIQKQTLEGATEEFNKAYGNVSERFSALEEGLQLAFNKANKTDTDLISSSQSQIAGLEYTIDNLNAALDDIQLQEDEINKKYDKRIDALDKIQSANDEIARQQRSQLSIADALSQGDISAAAKAIQDARAEQAQANLDNQRKNLEAARASEINGLTVNGKTRSQISAEVLSLQKQIKKIEEESLEPAQERVRLAEEKLQKDISNLVVLGQTKSEWENIASNIRIAATETKSFTDAMMAALGAAQNLSAVLKINRAIPMVDANITPAQYAAVVASAKSESSNPNLGGSGIAGPATARLLRMSSGGMVPKYFASGGFARGTDTVPSMLTPGEFVVKKYAVQDFGTDRLKAINSGTYSGESVYNYELNVNVKSDANPDEIARTVMTQIKQIDSQRLRGNRL